MQRIGSDHKRTDPQCQRRQCWYIQAWSANTKMSKATSRRDRKVKQTTPLTFLSIHTMAPACSKPWSQVPVLVTVHMLIGDHAQITGSQHRQKNENTTQSTRIWCIVVEQLRVSNGTNRACNSDAKKVPDIAFDVCFRTRGNNTVESAIVHNRQNVHPNTKNANSLHRTSAKRR
jgi:hypothetical protein